MKSKNFNPNYAAQLIELRTQVVHPNAERLIGWIVQGNRVWTSPDYVVGEKMVYFPLECCLNPEMISYLNLYRDNTKNLNKEAKGYFEDSCRVKALKLRGEPSEGIIIRLSSIQEFLVFKNGKPSEISVGDTFDELDGVWICKKYVPKNNRVPGEGNKTKNRQPRVEDNIVDGQFRLHYDTEKLATSEHLLKTGDICVITNKLHGTSFVVSKVLVKRKLNLLERALKFCGVKISETEYAPVYSSRRVIKGVGEKAKDTPHYYDADMWSVVNDELKDFLKDGLTFYGEIVGFTTNGSYIQSGYDYSCEVGSHKTFIYRITTTGMDGTVYEWDWASIKQFCEKFNLQHVPEFYYGPVDFTLAQLKEKYLEKKCDICKNDVPSEGICFRNESQDKIARKLKSFTFLKRESDQLDTGEIDMETQESTVDTE